MTFREKLQQEHPEKISERFDGGCGGCPYHYGYVPYGSECPLDCEECWNREIPETDAKDTAVGKIVAKQCLEISGDSTNDIMLACAKVIAVECHKRESCDGCIFDGGEYCTVADRPDLWTVALAKLVELEGR